MIDKNTILSDLKTCLEEHMVSIDESSISRIYQMIENPKIQFGIVSAFRKDLEGTVEEVKAENEKRHTTLKNEVRSMDYGFVELRGAYKEKGSSSNDIFEKSLIIGKITRDEIVSLGKKYNQDSVIWHGDGKFELIDRDGKTSRFSTTSFEVKDQSIDELMDLMKKDPAEFERLFIVGSWLKRGSKNKTGKKFNFVLESKPNPSWMRGMKEMKYGDDSVWGETFRFFIDETF